MRLSPHFTLQELTHSQTAARKGLSNTPSPEVVEALKNTAQVLEKVRTATGSPLVVSSGYRSPEVNAAVGGSKNSDHILGKAADVTSPHMSAHDLAEILSADIDDLGIGQIIFEFGSWVHISTRTPDKAINRVLTIDRQGTRPGIHPARS